MRGIYLLGAAVLGLVACGNSGNTATKADSLKQEWDTSLGKIKDSVKSKGEQTLSVVKEKIENLKEKKDTERDTIK